MLNFGHTSYDSKNKQWVNWTLIGLRVHCATGGNKRFKAVRRRNVHTCWTMDENGEILKAALQRRRNHKNMRQLPWEGLRLFVN